MTAPLRWHAFPARDFHLIVGRPTQCAPTLRASPGALALLDGPMFSSSGYTLTLQFDRARGISKATRRPAEGSTVYVTTTGETGVVRHADLDVSRPEISVACQGWPTLIRARENVQNPQHDQGSRWRAALCVLDGDQLAFALAPGSMHGFAARILREHPETTDAIYTDGGSSGRMAVLGAGEWGDPKNARVPTWLAHWPGATGPTTRSTSSTGTGTSSTGPALLVFALLLASR